MKVAAVGASCSNRVQSGTEIPHGMSGGLVHQGSDTRPLRRPFAGAAEEVERIVVRVGVKPEVHHDSGVDAGVVADIRGGTTGVPKRCLECRNWKQPARSEE